jgi:CelD/BcsL family acetyltransferase involved in cellulose biosynthesis
MAELEIIDCAERLREFEPEWLQLSQAVRPATPFQTPQWLLTWWSHFGSGTLQTFVFRNGGALIGVVPCFLHEWNGNRQLTLLGSGVSDYLDPQLDPGHVPEILALLDAHLKTRRDWDIGDWQDLSENTPLQQLGTTRGDTPCSAISLAGSFEGFLAGRPKDLRRNLRRYKEKAEAIAPVTFEVSKTADPDLINALIDLHRARWNQTGECGMIDFNRAEPFVRDIAPLFARLGSLRIFTVRFQGSVAAIVLALCDGTSIFSWLSAFDPATEMYGFGRELLAQALDYGYRHGYKSWHFLRGDEPYKFSWGAQAIPKCRVIIRP